MGREEALFVGFAVALADTGASANVSVLHVVLGMRNTKAASDWLPMTSGTISHPARVGSGMRPITSTCSVGLRAPRPALMSSAALMLRHGSRRCGCRLNGLSGIFLCGASFAQRLSRRDGWLCQGLGSSARPKLRDRTFRRLLGRRRFECRLDRIGRRWSINWRNQV